MYLSKHTHIKLLTVALMCFVSANAYALETGSSTFKVNGFGTLGLTKGSDKQLGFRESVSQKGVFDEYDLAQNSDIGIQFDYIATDKLKLGLQLIAKDRHNNSLDKSIEWAYLNYSLSSEINLRVGRLGMDGYMMSDYRQVGFTHLWTHQPAQFYGIQPALSFDGMDLTFNHSVYEGLLRTKLWLGQSQYDFYNNVGASETDLEQLYGLSVSWENQTWNFKISYSQSKTKVKNDPIKQLEEQLQTASLFGWPEAAGFTGLSVDNTITRYYGLGVTYDESDWIIQSELSLLTTEIQLTSDTLSGYLSVGRKIGNVTPFITGSWIRKPNGRQIIPTPQVSAFIPLQQTTQLVFNQFYAAQKAFSLGVRWDIKPKIALKAQWDKTWSEEYGDLLFDRTAATAKKSQLDTFSFTVDFLF